MKKSASPKSFENVSEDNIEEWLQSDACELGFQHMTDMGIVNAAMKQKGEEEGGRIRVKEDSVLASVTAWCYSVLTKLKYMGQRVFEYSDITATRKIHTAMRMILNISNAPNKIF
jgi:hypothetical protein